MMAIIEPPKDAKGREIPLDTTSIFGVNGKAYNIVRWEYITGFDEGSQTVHEWYGITEFLSVLEPEKLLLTPPDSWEKLEEDLDRAVESDNSDESDFESMACAYMNHSGDMCGDCKFRSKYVRNCTNQMLEDVVSRIRELRSDSE